MTDIVRDLYGNPLNRDATITTLRAEVEKLRAENEKLAEAVLCAALMLSERGLSSAEKCEMAYDYLSEIHAALSGDKP